MRSPMTNCLRSRFGRVDAHHHLWHYTTEDYPWMTDKMSILRGDFLEGDLAAVAGDSGICGTIVVQARQTIEETRWLSDVAVNSHLICGVVGWAPLADVDVFPILKSIASLPKLKGIRHILHDEADEAYMLREDFNRGISYLKEFNLVYDLLVFERHLPKAVELVDRHPDQIFVLDHIGKPQIRNRVLEPWKSNIRKLAQRDNVHCKISGMVTEANWKEWHRDDLLPYFDIVLEAFGADRLMFGSDWPVLTVAAPYRTWVSFVESATASLSDDEREKFWRKTAIKVYSLDQESK